MKPEFRSMPNAELTVRAERDEPEAVAEVVRRWNAAYNVPARAGVIAAMLDEELAAHASFRPQDQVLDLIQKEIVKRWIAKSDVHRIGFAPLQPQN